MSETGTCGCGKAASACPAPKAETKTEAKTEKSAKPATSGAIQNGKGDAPRNISEKFRSNYKGIRWTTGGQLKKGEKLVKVYR